MEVAKGYRDRDLPLDTMVVDFLHETKEGNMDLDPAQWPESGGNEPPPSRDGNQDDDQYLAPFRRGLKVL